MIEMVKRKSRNLPDVGKIEIEDYSFSYYDEDTRDIIFEPRVYHQRYQRSFDILINPRWRKDIKIITEYGCGEYKLMNYFKYFLSLRKINFVDIDAKLLKEKLPFIRMCDYHYSERRFNPLQVTAFEGSISDPDDRILNSDVVIGIEIIEHLYPDTLEAVPYVIFHSVRPKIVIFTTPNADFNEALPKFKGIRHPDHKFEWTRQQFESWALNIILRFPEYEVSFFGVGKGPSGTEHLGCCSQMALFLRKDISDQINRLPLLKCWCGKHYQGGPNCLMCHPLIPFGICSYMTKSKKFENIEENYLIFYKEIHSVDFLYIDDDRRTDEEKLMEIMICNMNHEILYGEKSCYVPLYKIISTQQFGVLISEEEAAEILRNYGFLVQKQFVKDDIGPVVSEEKLCVQYIADDEI
ncbi:small RNA 2'-O-methyltransferase-like [Harmonia axyridis]|uniref:small RNA 2'-O-methyltransferase-like n=1 Tax=Harmonia axyridis TaxID=115357 RepID=UPI001E2786CB|nr:small RNA 2'-O-methyltransferase-like [Harmonia axyridis]